MAKRSSLLSAFILALLVALQLTHASATVKNPPAGITLSPAIQELNIATSNTQQIFNLTYTNHTKGLQELDLIPEDFGSLNDTGGIVLEGSNTYTQKYGLVSWLKLETNNVVLQPSESHTVLVTVENRQDLQPGGHYGAVVAKVNSLGASDGNRVVINQQLVSLILVDKMGGEHYGMKLNSVQQNGNWLHLPNDIRLVFQNNGNVHVVPRGLVKLKSPDGQVIAQGVINTASDFVLPEANREIYVPLTKLGSSLALPGVYSVEVDYRYDGLNRYGSQTFAVHFIDLKLYVGLAMALIIVLMIIRRQHRHRLKGPTAAKKVD